MQATQDKLSKQAAALMAKAIYLDKDDYGIALSLWTWTVWIEQKKISQLISHHKKRRNSNKRYMPETGMERHMQQIRIISDAIRI